MHHFILGGIAGSWLLLTPLMWAQSPVHAGLAYSIGTLAVILSALTVVWGRARLVTALLGAVLVIAGMTFHAGIGQLANECAVGVALVLAGVAPGVQSHFVSEAVLEVRQPLVAAAARSAAALSETQRVQLRSAAA